MTPDQMGQTCREVTYFHTSNECTQGSVAGCMDVTHLRRPKTALDGKSTTRTWVSLLLAMAFTRGMFNNEKGSVNELKELLCFTAIIKTTRDTHKSWSLLIPIGFRTYQTWHNQPKIHPCFFLHFGILKLFSHYWKWIAWKNVVLGSCSVLFIWLRALPTNLVNITQKIKATSLRGPVSCDLIRSFSGPECFQTANRFLCDSWMEKKKCWQ